MMQAPQKNCSSLWALTDDYKKQVSTLLAQECEEASNASKNLLEAPKACHLMEVLAVIAACIPQGQDVSLVNPNGNDKFEKLKAPSSFKASLFQVVSEIKNAFNEGDRSMASINQTLNNIYDYMNDLLNAMQSLGDAEVATELELAVENIDDISKSCKDTALTARNKFTHALEVIQELEVFSTATNARIEKDEKAAEQALKEMEIREKRQKERLADLIKLKDENEKTLKKAVKDYEDKLAESNNVWNTFALMVLDCLHEVMEAGAKAAVRRIDQMGVVGKIEEGEKIGKEFADLAHDELTGYGVFKDSDGKPVDPLAVGIAMAIVDALKTVIKEKAAEKNDKIIKENIDLMKGVLQDKDKATTSEGKLGVQKCQKLLEILEKFNDKKDEFDAMAANVHIFVVACDSKATSENKIDISQSKEIPKEERDTLVSIQQKNVDRAERQMERTQELAEKFRKEKEAQEDAYDKTIASMERLKVEQADLTEILKYIKKAVDQLTFLEDAWNQIISFFEYINRTVNNNLIKYVGQIERRKESSSAANRAVIAREATKACVTAAVLSYSAKFYVEISQQHVIPVIKKSAKGINLSVDEAKAMQAQIKGNFDSTEDEIEKQVKKHQDAVNKEVIKTLDSHGFHIEKVRALLFY